MIGGDSIEYELLEKCCKLIKNSDPLTCEIGVRLGMGSEVILQSLKDKNHWHIGIDPYGDIDYKHFDQKMEWQGKPTPPKYSNNLKKNLLKDLSEHENFSLIQLEDDEFFKRYGDGFPIYRNKKILKKEYDLVFFDGPHTTLQVLKEAIFFGERSKPGTVFVFDDYPDYNMSSILNVIVNNFGFLLLKQGKNKMALKRN